jgi:hypothetical protein
VTDFVFVRCPGQPSLQPPPYPMGAPAMGVQSQPQPQPQPVQVVMAAPMPQPVPQPPPVGVQMQTTYVTHHVSTHDAGDGEEGAWIEDHGEAALGPAYCMSGLEMPQYSRCITTTGGLEEASVYVQNRCQGLTGLVSLFVYQVVAMNARRSMQVQCPSCRHVVMTQVQYEPNGLTFLACAAIALVGCWMGCCLVSREAHTVP